MNRYNKDGYVLVDDIGVYFVAEEAITKYWKDKKGYRDIAKDAIHGVAMENGFSVMVKVVSGQEDAARFATDLYNRIF